MPIWIAAPTQASNATLKVFHADNQLVILMNGDKIWNSGWTTGDPNLGGIPINIALPTRGYVDVSVLGANGGLGNDPYNFKTQLVIPGRIDLPIQGTEAGDGAPGILYTQTYRIFRPYLQLGASNPKWPRFHSDVSLHQKICPIYSTVDKERTYRCEIDLQDQGSNFAGVSFRIRETDGDFKFIRFDLYRIKLKGDDADDLPSIEFEHVEIDNFEGTPLVTLRCRNYGTKFGKDDIFADVQAIFFKR